MCCGNFLFSNFCCVIFSVCYIFTNKFISIKHMIEMRVTEWKRNKRRHTHKLVLDVIDGKRHTLWVAPPASRGVSRHAHPRAKAGGDEIPSVPANELFLSCNNKSAQNQPTGYQNQCMLELWHCVTYFAMCKETTHRIIVQKMNCILHMLNISTEIKY